MRVSFDHAFLHIPHPVYHLLLFTILFTITFTKFLASNRICTWLHRNKAIPLFPVNQAAYGSSDLQKSTTQQTKDLAEAHGSYSRLFR